MQEDPAELRISNDASADATELRRRVAEDGYLFIRRLLDPDKIGALRTDMMAAIQRGGWLVPGTDPREGIADVSRRCTEGDLDYSAVYHQVYRLESFHGVAHEPEITSMADRIMGRPSIPLPHKVARIWFPKNTEHTTPIHQDFVHFQGSFDVLTCWSPVGDCPIELGGLAILPGSHRVGKVLRHHFSLGAGGLWIDLEEERKRHPELDVPWRSTNFEAGDTLFFPALTLHKALPNRTENRLRVSLDNRCQAVGGRVAWHMLEPHLSDVSPLSWEQVYQGWEHDDLKHYWRKHPWQVIPRYFGYQARGFAEALELARSGDERALLQLRRILRANPATPEARAASAVLAERGEAG